MGRHRSRRIGAAAGTPVGLFLVIAAAYAVGAEMSWQLFGAADIGLAFFPAAGITLAAMVLSRPRRWPVIIAAIVVAEMAVDLRHDLRWPHAVGYSVANAAEPLVGAVLVRHRARGPIDLARRGGMVRFLASAVIAGPLVGATIGGATKAIQSSQGFGEAAAHWWAGDALGVLTIGVAVLLVALGGGSTSGALAGKVAAQFVMLGASLVAFVALEVPPVFIVLPVLLWIAMRQSVRSVSLASATMALVANVATAEGRGPFAALDLAPQSQLTVAQLTLATTILTAWFLAVEVAERNGLALLHAEDLAIRERARSLTLVGELSESLVRARSVDDVGVAVRSIISERFDAAVVVIDLFDPVSGRFRLAPAGLPDDVVQRVGDWTRTAPFPGPVVARTGKPLWIDSSAELLRRFPVLGAVPQAQDVQVLGALPLAGPDGPMGYLIVARHLARPFTHAERDDLKAAAHAASQAVHRALLQEADSARLAQSEQRFRSIADGAPLVIWVHDEHGRQQWVNQTFCDYFGVDRDSMDDHAWPSLVHPDDKDRYGREFTAAVTARHRFHARVRVRRADGAWRWFESWGMPQFDPSSRYTGHVGTSADITDRVEVEQLRDRRAADDRFRAALVESLRRDLPIEELRSSAERLLAAHLDADVRVVLPDHEDADATSTRMIWARAAHHARRSARGVRQPRRPSCGRARPASGDGDRGGARPAAPSARPPRDA